MTTTKKLATALCLTGAVFTLHAEIVVPDSPVNLVRDGRAYTVESEYNSLGTSDNGDKAFNGSLSDRWVGIKPTPSTGRIPAATVHFANRLAVNAYRIYGHVNQSVSRSPKAWTFYGSKDGETWVAIDSRSNQTGWSTGEGRLYSCAEIDRLGRVLDYHVTTQNKYLWDWNFKTMETKSEQSDSGYMVEGSVTKAELAEYGIDAKSFWLGVYRADCIEERKLGAWCSAMPMGERPSFHRQGMFFPVNF